MHPKKLFQKCRFLAGLAIVATAMRVAAAQPNIVFVLADDLGYGDTGYAWQNARTNAAVRIHTPALDRFAREGVTLTDHYAAAPVCAPSRASLLTGRRQGRCSLRDNNFDFPISERETLGSVLKKAGYRTYAVGKWGVGGGGESGLPATAHPLDRGFDRYYGFLDHMAGHTYYHYDGSIRNAWMGVTEDRERANETAAGIYSTDLFTAKAKQFIEDHCRDCAGRPFFLFLAINTIHGSGRLGDDVPCRKQLHVPGRDYPEGGGLSGGVRWPLEREPRETRNTWIDPAYSALGDTPAARYATAITRFDHAFGDLMQELEDLHLATNTIVVFTSDNGPTTEYGTDPRHFESAGPFDGEKRDVYEGGMRVGALVRWPGKIEAGSRDGTPSQFHDWMATLAAAAGAAPSEECDGVDLLPRWGAGPGEARQGTVYTQYYFPAGHLDPYASAVAGRKGDLRGTQQMIREGDWVALRTRMEKEGRDTAVRLYNVRRDPYQTQDLAKEEPEKAAALKAKLDEMFVP